MTQIVRRLLNPDIPLTTRASQLVNVVLEALPGLDLVQVVEYPKCGGSWIRNMIRTYRRSRLFTHDRIVRPHDVIMTHRTYRSRFGNPIVVTRDPRDVYVSFYHYEISYQGRHRHAAVFDYFQHDPSRSLRVDFAEYIEAKLNHLTEPWFSYAEFFNSWQRQPSALFIRYEDCLDDAAGQLTRILRHIGDPIETARIEETIRETSFKAITRKQYGQAREAGQADNRRFHRKGVSGDWKNHFNARSCRLLQEHDGDLLKQLGHEPDASWIDRFLDETDDLAEEEASAGENRL